MSTEPKKLSGVAAKAAAKKAEGVNGAGGVASSPSDVEVLRAEIETLKARDTENQKKINMLYEVADKGRVFNYESQRQEKKPFRVKLSRYGGGVIVGWRTVKDVLVKNPTTGLTVGEEQVYEVLVLNEQDQTVKMELHGYPQFSDARYNDRLDAEVVGKTEDWTGKTTLDLRLPDGRTIDVDARFVN